jgi:hypothetical protein
MTRQSRYDYVLAEFRVLLDRSNTEQLADIECLYEAIKGKSSRAHNAIRFVESLVPQDDGKVRYAVVKLFEAEVMGRADHIGVVRSVHDTAQEARNNLPDPEPGTYYTVGIARGFDAEPLFVGEEFPEFPRLPKDK